MIATQTVLKTVYEIIIFPVTRIIINKVKKVENIDTFDVNIKYNPFSFQFQGGINKWQDLKTHLE